MKRSRQPWDYNTAIIDFLGIKGEPVTDTQGRTAAVGRFRYQFGESAREGDEPVQPIAGEDFTIEVQMYLDPVSGWQPVGGYAAVQKAAVIELQRQQEPLADYGKKRLDQLQEARDRLHPDHAERVANARRAAEAIRVRQPTIHWTKTGLLRQIGKDLKAEKRGIPLSTLKDMEKAGELGLKLNPDD